jgi:hypothetical protein
VWGALSEKRSFSAHRVAKPKSSGDAETQMAEPKFKCRNREFKWRERTSKRLS